MRTKKWFFWKEQTPEKKFIPNPSMLNGNTRTETLIRELMQNSADAKDEGSELVTMVVEIGDVPLSAIDDALCLDDLRDHIQGTIEMAENDNKNVRIVEKSKEQQAILKKQTLRYLKFSDYGTKGIEGAKKYDSQKALWKLVFEEGTSEKKEGSAGGVGIGKNATFPFSLLSTVLYVTRTEEGYGLSGSARLATSQIGNDIYKTNGYLISYESEKENEVMYQNRFDTISAVEEDEFEGEDLQFLRRKDLGTDVIILGIDTEKEEFTLKDEEVWPYYFAVYAIKNFLPAFINKKIMLKIRFNDGNEIIVDENCADVLNRIKEKTKDSDLEQELSPIISTAERMIDTYCNYNKDNTDMSCVTHSFPDIGEVDLYMNKKSNVQLKKWMLFRSFGIKTIEKDPKPQKPVLGIAIVKDSKGSDFLLRAETANHEDYDYNSLGAEKDKYRKSIRELESWIRQEMRDFGRISTDETDIELAGLANFISIDDDIKIGEEQGDKSAKMEIILPPVPKQNAKKGKNVRKRETTPEPFEDPDPIKKHEQWNHNPDKHKEWQNQRETPTVEEDRDKQTYIQTYDVKTFFRDTKDPIGKKVELVGKLLSAAFDKIDIEFFAVDEKNKENKNMPPIVSAFDVNSNEQFTIKNKYMIKDVPVTNKSVHIEVEFAQEFRAALLEKATAEKVIERVVSGNKQEAEKEVEDNKNESAN